MPARKTDQQRVKTFGRSTVRRLNRFEYENTMRAVLEAPWLEIADWLPEDRTAHLFNKVGDRLDISHVQMARYLEAASHGVRTAMNTAAFPFSDQ